MLLINIQISGWSENIAGKGENPFPNIFSVLLYQLAS